MILLERAYLPEATLGVWTMPGGWSCRILENPWKGNTPYVSCIPEGIYTLRMRPSNVVRQTSKGEFTEGWEITNVPGRTFIMLHPGAYERHTEGCQLPGDAHSWHPDEGPMVTNSVRTFRQLMARLAERAEWTIDIRCRTVQWP